jgi:hypothetical protein
MCIDDVDALLPYKPGTTDDPEIGRLKRIIATKDAELRCYREVFPGRYYSAKINALVDDGFPEDDAD